MSQDFWTPERLHAIGSLADESVCVKIRGSCMEPGLLDGASVCVRSSGRYWPGDVLVVRSPTSGLLAHRLIGGYRKGGEWRHLTQADAAQRPDSAIARQDILGKIVGGDCATEIASVPFKHRAWALLRFCRFAATQPLKRIRAAIPHYRRPPPH